jgi:predicted Zn-dependent protease
MANYTEADYPDLPWEFTLLDSDVINAFALPGGKVFMSRGLAERLDNEAQLAGVLGHEIGHVTARHGNERISQQLLVAGIAVGATVAAGQSDSDAVKYGVPIAVGVGGQGYLLKFGRGQELEADRLGMRYMSYAGYDPYGQLQVMQVLAEASQGPRQPELLSTHPHPESRIQQIQDLLATEYAHTQNNPAFELKRDRYHNLFLSRLAELPPATQGDKGTFSLASASSWCALCAAHQQHRPSLPNHEPEAINRKP